MQPDSFGLRSWRGTHGDGGRQRGLVNFEAVGDGAASQERDLEVISKVTVGGVESHRTQPGAGRVGINMGVGHMALLLFQDRF